MNLPIRFLTPATLLALLALAGCSGVDAANALGIGRNPPDEFAVVDRPPLSMPPDFALHPPQPGAARPQEVAMPDRAKETLFGADATVAKATDESDGEKALLQEAGASKAEPGIREIIDRETAQRVVGSKQLIDSILWWRKSDSSTTVDASAEAKRIQDAKDKNQSISTGATPIIEKDKSGWLGL